MLEFKQETGTTTFGNPSLPRRAHSRSSSLSSSPRISCSKGSPVPSNGFEPQADVVLRPSALHLAERIFTRLMKLRKKALLASSCFPLESSGAFREEARSYSLDSVVDLEREYDSDEHLGFVGVETPTSLSSSSSSRGSSSSESQAKSPHKPGSQMMANMLLSLLKDEASRFTVFEDEDEHQFNGPRESAWHQPEEEILTDQEWRMMRYGHLQAKPVVTKKLQSSSSKYLAMGEFSTSKLHPTMAASLNKNSSFTRSKREKSKHM